VKRLSLLVLSCFVLGLFLGCAGPKVKVGNQKVIETSGSKPDWLIKIPETKGGKAYFRGIKTNAPTLEGALTDARMSASRQVAEMSKTEANIDYENARVERGIAKDDRAIGSVIKDGIIMLSDALVQGLKESESYYEKVEETTQTGVIYFYNYQILTTITEEDYKRVANSVYEKQIAKAREENNKKAEDFLSSMKEDIQKKKLFQE